VARVCPLFTTPRNSSSPFKKVSYDFPVLLDANNAVSAAYSVSALPSEFGIDREGRIVFSHAGALDWSDSSLRDALRKLLEKKPKRLPSTIEARLFVSEG
jgi:hypothetical protein